MNKFNLWDLWDFSDVEVNKIDGKTYRGHLICVDEGLEELDEDGIIVTVENSDGIRGHTAKYIESIIIYEKGRQKYKIIREGDTWQKMIIT